MPDDERYHVKVENIFEGPMDLLVYLIKKHEVDIYDIPIALITDRYLQYIAWMKAMNIDFAGDFLLMAATLAHIKSRMLLPVHESLEDEDAEDPRLEITRPLLEYLRMKAAAEQLAGRNILGEDTYNRQPPKEELDDLKVDPSTESLQVSLFELIDAFQQVLEKIPGDHRVDFSEERFSIQDKIAEIVDILEAKGSVVFYELFAGKTVKAELIVTFLAILELAKVGLIEIAQQVQTGVIRLFYL